MPSSNGTCLVCGEKILLMCRKGTEVCSENCQKIHEGDKIAYEKLIESEDHHASE